MTLDVSKVFRLAPKELTYFAFGIDVGPKENKFFDGIYFTFACCIVQWGVVLQYKCKNGCGLVASTSWKGFYDDFLMIYVNFSLSADHVRVQSRSYFPTEMESLSL